MDSKKKKETFDFVKYMETLCTSYEDGPSDHTYIHV